MNIKKRFIGITHEFEGWHQWEDAPQNVSFLRNRHRHIFKIKIEIEVFSEKRDLEFFNFKWFVQSIVKEKLNRHMLGSCEQQSDELAKHIQEKYPNRDLIIYVKEDGENYAKTEYEKQQN